MDSSRESSAAIVPICDHCPPELLVKIFGYLDITEVLKLRDGCVYFKDIIDKMVTDRTVAIRLFGDVHPRQLAKFRQVSASWREAIDSKVLGDATIAKARRDKFLDSLERLFEALYRCVLHNDTFTATRLLAVTEIDSNRRCKIFDYKPRGAHLEGGRIGTLLIEAAAQGHTDMVSLLLKQPCVDVDERDSVGRSALAASVSSSLGKVEAVFDMLWERSSPANRDSVERPARFRR